MPIFTASLIFFIGLALAFVSFMSWISVAKNMKYYDVGLCFFANIFFLTSMHSFPVKNIWFPYMVQSGG